MSTVTKSRKTSSRRSTPAEPVDSRLVLANAISQVEKGMTSFTKSVESWDSIRENIIEEIDNEIQTKKRARDDIQIEFDTKKKRLELELKVDYDMQAYEKATEVLEERKEVAINQQELNNLKNEVKEWEQKYSEDLSKLRENLISAHGKELERALQTCTLTHEMETAEMKAEAGKFRSLTENMQKQLDLAETRLEEERGLVRSIAESSRSAPIEQHFGGK